MHSNSKLELLNHRLEKKFNALELIRKNIQLH